MHEQELITVVQLCRAVEPSTDFKERSRRLIAALPQKRPTWIEVVSRELVENLKFTFSLALASFILVAVFGGFAYWRNFIPGGRFTNESRELLSEAEQINLGIELGEAEYFTESAREMTLLLGEIRKPEEVPVDDLLDQIIF
ncbi:MAG: hypothetical protein AAB518_01300 [Patescibacteria group bacterium]